MNLNNSNRKSIKRNELTEFVGKEIIIVMHTPSKQEGLKFTWYNVPVTVILLEYNDLKNSIMIEKDGEKYKLNLYSIDEIYA